MAKEDTGSRLVWFLAGAAIGAVVALIYAPASGEQARRYIVRKTEKSKDALTDTGKDIIDRGREYFEKGRQIADEAGELFEKGRKLVSR